ncbi:tubulin nucleotide-binding domain-like protein [Rhizoclosmatium globosum]|uniref:Tubulin nucleotide-binding domain-like protein n=1 Tax=Rhizoclosmatium globosum TaxID=329046 RepID=A0A1Y2CYA8_9FUNG|nr:tubulin nucleotide-binding domain-like protein [Rhizoclosmatium globosum]|eukprot:ORY51998.1 tubulin nucleotide-binding domain-like protein [Rhizoclosmatium globosum]
MNRTREVITLQLGHTASFVGTHLWNALDIADPDTVDTNVLIRSGIDPERGTATYAPRLVIVDLKGSLGTLKKINQLYEDSDTQADVSWNGKVDVRKQDPLPKNEYLNYLDTDPDQEDDEDDDKPQQTQQQHSQPNPKQFSKVLDSAVSVWSDYNSMFYHPRTVVEIPSYSHDDSISPFAIYNQGSDLWTSNHDLQDDILENRIRFFLEECDSPQGIQVLADVGDAFSGFTARCLESLREDVGKLCITVYGVSDGDDGVVDSVRGINESLAMAQISEFASLYVPVRKPTGLYRNSNLGGFGVKSSLQSRYHWTACLAASIDSLTLPMRLAKGPTSMSALISPLTQAGVLGMLASSVPFPFNDANSSKELFAKEVNMGDHVDWVRDDTFGLPYDVIESCIGQVSVLRGVQGLNSTELKASFNDFLSRSPTPIGCNTSYTSESGFPISLAFPDIFNPSTPASAIPLYSRLRASSRLAGLVGERVKALEQIPGKVLRMMGEQDVSKEFLASNVDLLGSLRDTYDQEN